MNQVNTPDASADGLVLGLELTNAGMLARVGGKAANLGETSVPGCPFRPDSA